jgi:hypothetical protein
MDPQLFDRLTRAFSRAGSRRWLVRRLTSLPLTGLLAVVAEETAASARGRKAHRHHAHDRHRHPKAERRKEQRDTHGEACIPTGQRCPAKKPRGKQGKKLSCSHCCQGASTTDASGKRVCACRPTGTACTTDSATACCSGLCDAGSCQAATPCNPPCSACQRCDATTTSCVADDTRAGQACGACHTCDATGQCQPVADGTACSDGNACTQTDTCQAGVCVGSNPVVCAALDQCHDVGVCEPGTGACTNPPKTNGTTCNDGDPCTLNDVCTNGVCGGTPVSCPGTQTCQGGACGVSCGSNFCPAANTVCDGTTCRSCTVCATCTHTTVQAAINAAAPGATIFICAGTYAENLSIPISLALVGAGDGDDPASDTILQGIAGGGPVVDIPANGQNVALHDLRIRGGNASARGGGVNHFGATLTMNDCTLTGNLALDGGGGLFNAAISTASLTGCTISRNTTPGSGGGIFNSGALTLTNCLIDFNAFIGGDGGGICNNNTGFTLTLNNTVVSRNSALNGGGIANDAGHVELIGSQVEDNNSARVNGGGVYNAPDAILTLGASSVTGNTAQFDGGGIYNESLGTVDLQGGSSVEANHADGQGGGILNQGDVNGCGTGGTVRANTAGVAGTDNCFDAGGGIGCSTC